MLSHYIKIIIVIFFFYSCGSEIDFENNVSTSYSTIDKKQAAEDNESVLVENNKTSIVRVSVIKEDLKENSPLQKSIESADSEFENDELENFPDGIEQVGSEENEICSQYLNLEELEEYIDLQSENILEGTQYLEGYFQNGDSLLIEFDVDLDSLVYEHCFN